MYDDILCYKTHCKFMQYLVIIEQPKLKKQIKNANHTRLFLCILHFYLRIILVVLKKKIIQDYFLLILDCLKDQTHDS